MKTHPLPQNASHLKRPAKLSVSKFKYRPAAEIFRTDVIIKFRGL